MGYLLQLSDLTFKKPTNEDKDAIFAFRSAYLAYYSEKVIHGGSELHRFEPDDFGQWLDYVYAPAGTNWYGYDKVASDTFLIYRDEIMVGIVNVRHYLTEPLLKVGGHIGYSTHPAYQRQGIATKALAFGLLWLERLGVEKVLVTCYEHNRASAKAIEKCGGVLENTLTVNGLTVCRYWI